MGKEFSQQNKDASADTPQGVVAPPVSPMARLQRLAGNQAVQGLMRSVADPGAAETDRILRAAARAQRAPDDRTTMFLSGSEVAYRIISRYLPGYASKISGAGCNDSVDDVKAERSGRDSIDVVVGHRFVLGINANTLDGHVARVERALVRSGVQPVVQEAPAAADAQNAETPAPPVDAVAAKEKEFAARGTAALEAVRAAGHKTGQHMRGQLGQGAMAAGTAFPAWFMELQKALMMSGEWKQVEEDAQHILRDYALWFLEQRHGGRVPASLRTFFDYIGRSAQNDADARKGGYLGTAHFGGTAGAPNWCTFTSNRSLLDGLKSVGYVPLYGDDEFLKNLVTIRGEHKMFYARNEAYAQKLEPGDIVMFLFEKCQWGGHTATVVEDLGDSFLHVSGNTGDAIGVGISEAKRMKEKPARLNLDIANDSSSAQKKAEANAHIASVPFGDKVLVYSITRTSQPFAALMELNEIDPVKQADYLKSVLAKFHLRKARP